MVSGFYWRGNTPLNYDPTKPSGSVRTQDDLLFKESNGMYLMTREAAYLTGSRVGLKSIRYVIPAKQCLDIDTAEDFELAEIWY